MTLTTRDIAWLAGLLEGEGCFFTIKNGYSPRVAIGMTDKDIIQRSAAMVGAKCYLAKRKNKPQHHKEQHWWMLSGHTAAAVMMTIYAFMGQRRRAKIKDVLARWKMRPLKQKPRGTGIVTNCKHVDRGHYAHGLCRPCYAGRQVRGEYKTHEQLSRTA